jgi:hypothetical protein
VIDDERYFLSLMRYIHLNPLRAGSVKSVSALARYRWTGYSVLMGYQGLDWQDVDEVLSRFGKRVGPARRELSAFMGLKEARDKVSVFEGGGVVRSAKKSRKRKPVERQRKPKEPEVTGDGRVVGGGEFVRFVLKKIGAGPGDNPALQLETARQRSERFHRLVNAVCDRFDVSKDELYGGNRRNAVSRARRVLSYLATRRLQMSAAEVGREINISGQGILKAADRGRSVLSETKISEEELIAE